MKILLAGDSFAADWSVKYDVQGWPNLLANEYDVTNVAQAGCSEYKILKQLKDQQDFRPYDAIIVSHTSPYRVHTAYHPVHCNDKLHANSDFIYNDVKSHNIHSMIEYYEKFFDLEYAKDVHRLLCKEIEYMTYPYPTIHITHFDWSELYPLRGLIDFSKLHKKNRGDANHYNNAGNVAVFEELKQRLSKI